jgi:hypothetical protein
MSDYDIHSCGYYCNRPACIEAQRNELRDKLFEIRTSERNIQTSDTKPAESLQPLGQEPLLEGWPLWSGLPTVFPGGGSGGEPTIDGWPLSKIAFPKE